MSTKQNVSPEDIHLFQPLKQSSFTEIRLYNVTLWFSFQTCIGFHSFKTGKVIRHNEWGSRTGRHLNYLQPDKEKRVSGQMFHNLLEEVIS